MTTRAHLVLNQGATFRATLRAEANTLNNSMIYASMRRGVESSNVYSFTTSHANNVVTLEMSANTTSGISAGRYLYDVLAVSGGVVTRVFEGVVTVSPGVTTLPAP